MICPKCSKETIEYPFCSQCGQDMTEKCAVCNKNHPVGTLWCPVKRKHIQSFKEAEEEANRIIGDLKKSPARKIGHADFLTPFVWIGILAIPLSVIWFAIWLGNSSPTNLALIAAIILTTFGGLLLLAAMLGGAYISFEILVNPLWKKFFTIEYEKRKPKE